MESQIESLEGTSIKRDYQVVLEVFSQRSFYLRKLVNPSEWPEGRRVYSTCVKIQGQKRLRQEHEKGIMTTEETGRLEKDRDFCVESNPHAPPERVPTPVPTSETY